MEVLILQPTANHGKIIVKDGRIVCPRCGKGKTQKVLPTTRGTDIVIFCKLCGKESIVNIDECLCQSACAT